MAIPHTRPDLFFIKDLDLRYDNEPYSLTDYDISNIIAIYDSILGDAGDLVILGPTDFTTTLLGSIACAVALIYHSLKSQSDAMYKALEEGDIVCLDGKRGQFIGVESFDRSIDSRPKIKIMFRNALVVGLNLDQAWRLTKCAPGTRRIDRFDKEVQQTARPYYILKELLGFEKSQIPPALNVKLPVVTMKRKSLLHYSNMSVGNLPCPSVLPAGYYSYEDRFERIGKDPLQRDPIICFTSDIGVAARIANNHQGGPGILVCDHRKLRGNLSHIAGLQANNKRTVLLSGMNTIERDDISSLESLDFNIMAWTPSAVRDADVKSVSPVRPASNPLLGAGYLLHNVAYGKTERLVADSTKGDEIGVLRRKLYLISREMSHTDDISRFFGISYELLMRLACLPLSLKQLDMLGHNCKHLTDTLDELLILLYTVVPSSVTSLLAEIREGMLRCIDSHRYNHPKYEIFCESIKELGVNDRILVRNNREKRILIEWLSEYAKPLRVLTLGQALASDEAIQNCLTLGWYGRKHARLKYSGFCRSQTIILYPFENVWKDANSIGISSYLRTISGQGKPVPSMERAEFTSPELEEIINRLSAEWGRSLLEQQFQFADALSAVEAIPVEFEEDYIAFLTLGHNCRCLDEDDEKIAIKNVTELRIGDLLVFVKDSAEDIFDKFTELIKRSNTDIKKQADLAELWKHAFLRHMRIHDLSYREFQQRLSLVGVERTVATIRTWGRKDCIGPEDDALRAIAEITQDPELNARLDDVLAACRQIRSLHIGLGRYLARAIVSSTASDLLPEEEPVLQRVSSDLSSHAEVVTVREVATKKFDVPLNKTNRLLNKFEDI